MTRASHSPAELNAFCAQIALMLGSGLPLYDGLEALAVAVKDSGEAESYHSLSMGVMESGSLYQTLKKDGSWPKYMVEMTGVGERAGCLEQVMNGLALHYEREGRIYGAIRSAITYPVVLGVMMLVVVLVMIVKVLPVFQRVLSSMGVVLNESGHWMMRAGAIAGWLVVALVGLIMLAALACVVLMHTAARERTANLLRKLFPPFARLNRKLSSARTADLLSMLLTGGFPLEDALDMLPGVLEDTGAANEIEKLRVRMSDGSAFADALAESELFEPLHSRMIRMGAAAGREDEVMARLARTYEEDVETGVASLVSVIEPTLVALLCIVIGAILLSVMMPMAGIITSII